MTSLEAMDKQIQLLREEIATTESQLQSLKVQLQKFEQEAQAALAEQQSNDQSPSNTNGSDQPLRYSGPGGELPTAKYMRQDGLYDFSAVTAEQRARGIRWPLQRHEYKRYGRQLIMPELGLPGQMNLKNAKVLIVGVGGLGCPAAAYLAGAGIGHIGLVDGDTVETSNLHRQIAHTTARVGMRKVDSAYEFVQAINPNVRCDRYRFHLSPEKAISIFQDYDIILDCTDHPTSRYLISDACVLTGKTLVSASALKTEGQLIVLNDPPRPPGDVSGGPCYRCIFPKPPPAESVLSCGEGGILGPVVGVMGVLQALEAIKLLTKTTPATEIAMSNGTAADHPAKPSMLMFSAYNTPPFRSVRMRSRRNNCAVCSPEAIITAQSLTSGSLDYIAFCGVTTPINVLPPTLRISAADFSKLPRDDSNVLIDTRDETQYAICALENSVNVPWTGDAETWLDRAQQSGVMAEDGREKYIVCRFGNDSQLAAKAMMDRANNAIAVKDIKGGLQSWRSEVDPEWPDY